MVEKKSMLPKKYNAPFTLGPEDAEKACLLVHGFTGWTAEMRGLGEYLAARGIRVHGVALTGHTGEPDDLARSTRKDWIASAEAGMAELGAYKHLFVAGLSMGGVLALLLAAHHPERIEGVIAMSTPTRFVRSWQINLVRPFVKWFYPLKVVNFDRPEIQEDFRSTYRLQDPDFTLDFSDPRVVAELQNTRISVAALAELTQLIEAGKMNLDRVRCPLLVLQGKLDRTVPPVCAEDIMRLAKNAHPKTLHWLEHSDHVITIGPQREEVYRLVAEFIEEPRSLE